MAQNREAIVQRMIDAGESEENIATVIQSFSPDTTITPYNPKPRPSFGDVVSGSSSNARPSFSNVVSGSSVPKPQINYLAKSMSGDLGHYPEQPIVEPEPDTYWSGFGKGLRDYGREISSEIMPTLATGAYPQTEGDMLNLVMMGELPSFAKGNPFKRALSNDIPEVPPRLREYEPIPEVPPRLKEYQPPESHEEFISRISSDLSKEPIEFGGSPIGDDLPVRGDYPEISPANIRQIGNIVPPNNPPVAPIIPEVTPEVKPTFWDKTKTALTDFWNDETGSAKLFSDDPDTIDFNSRITAQDNAVKIAQTPERKGNMIRSDLMKMIQNSMGEADPKLVEKFKREGITESINLRLKRNSIDNGKSVDIYGDDYGTSGEFAVDSPNDHQILAAAKAAGIDNIPVKIQGKFRDSINPEALSPYTKMYDKQGNKIRPDLINEFDKDWQGPLNPEGKTRAQLESEWLEAKRQGESQENLMLQNPEIREKMGWPPYEPKVKPDLMDQYNQSVEGPIDESLVPNNQSLVPSNQGLAGIARDMEVLTPDQYTRWGDTNTGSQFGNTKQVESTRGVFDNFDAEAVATRKGLWGKMTPPEIKRWIELDSNMKGPFNKITPEMHEEFLTLQAKRPGPKQPDQYLLKQEAEQKRLGNIEANRLKYSEKPKQLTEGKKGFWSDETGAIGKNIDESPNRPGKREDGITIKRGERFEFDGNYNVTDGKNESVIFRDTEDGWWYRDLAPGEKQTHYTTRLLGFNKKEALEKLKEFWATERKPGFWRDERGAIGQDINSSPNNPKTLMDAQIKYIQDALNKGQIDEASAIKMMDNLHQSPINSNQPKPGMVRMYHGGASNTPGKRWFSSDKVYAEEYARKSGGEVSYVDVPENHPSIAPDYPEQSIAKGFHVNTELPADIANQRRSIDPNTGEVIPKTPKLDYKQLVQKEEAGTLTGPELNELIEMRVSRRSVAPNWAPYKGKTPITYPKGTREPTIREARESLKQSGYTDEVLNKMTRDELLKEATTPIAKFTNKTVTSKTSANIPEGTVVTIKPGPDLQTKLKQAKAAGFQLVSQEANGNYKFKKMRPVKGTGELTRKSNDKRLLNKKQLDPALPIKERPGFEPEKVSKIQQAYDLSRGMMSVDLPFMTSAAFRQAAPLAWTGNWFKAWSKAAGSFKSEEAYNAIMAKVHSNKYAQPKYEPIYKNDVVTGYREKKSLSEELGLSLTDLGDISKREEHLRSQWAEQIPGYGRYVKASNRAYTAFLNDLRMNKFEQMIDQAKAAGNDPEKDLVLGKQIADFVNNATGRGTMRVKILGLPEKVDLASTKLLTNALFSPRLMARNVKFLNPVTYLNPSTSPQVRLEYLKGLGRTVGTWWGIAGLAKMAGAEVSLDPRNSDFGKIKIGDTRIDPGAGFQQFVTLLSRQANGKTVSSTSGKTSKLDSKPMIYDPRFTFAINKLHPTARLAFDLMSASSKRPVNLMDRSVQMMLPMLSADLVKVSKEDPAFGALVGVLSSVGFGAQTYEPGSFNEPSFVPKEYDVQITKSPLDLFR